MTILLNECQRIKRPYSDHFFSNIFADIAFAIGLCTSTFFIEATQFFLRLDDINWIIVLIFASTKLLR